MKNISTVAAMPTPMFSNISLNLFTATPPKMVDDCHRLDMVVGSG